LNQIIVLCDSFVPRIITDDISPSIEFTIALGVIIELL